MPTAATFVPGSFSRDLPSIGELYLAVHAALHLGARGSWKAVLRMVIVQKVLPDERPLELAADTPGDPGIGFTIARDRAGRRSIIVVERIDPAQADIELHAG